MSLVEGRHSFELRSSQSEVPRKVAASSLAHVSANECEQFMGKRAASIWTR